MALVIFALSASGPANASAAAFTASATGNLTGKPTTAQYFTFPFASMHCSTADTTGTIVSTSSTEQLIKVEHGVCGFYGVAVLVSPIEYLLTANGNVHILNTVTMTAPSPGCFITIKPQKAGTAAFSNNGGKLRVTYNIGFAYTSTVGLWCNSPVGNATFTGTSELERVGGGSLSFDP